MVFACCFGGGGGGVVVQERAHVYAGPGTEKKDQFSDLQGGHKTGSTFLTGTTTTLSAATNVDTSAVQHLNTLNAALAGLSGSWYERTASAANRLASVSGAVLCTVSVLDGAHERFTVVQFAGKDPLLTSGTPPGSQLPALQSVAPAAHVAAPGTGGGLRYNSLQVLQLLQTPFLYSFSDSPHVSLESNQPPHDWQALHNEQGLSDFCALPLTHNKSVVGAVTLAFMAPSGAGRQPGQQQQRASASGGGGLRAASPLMSCDEQSIRTLGYLLSALLIGQDLQLAQQVGDVLSGVHDARNLQQVVSAVTGGAEQVLRLTTRVMVATNVAVLIATAGSGGTAPGSGPGPTGGGPLSSTGSGGRAIFFEERSGSSGSRVDGSAQGIVGLRAAPSFTDPASTSYGPGAGNRSRLQRANTSTEGPGGGPTAGLNPQPSLTSQRARGGSTAILSSRNGMSQDGTVANGSQGGLLWQGGQVQARVLGLRHTLLANLPSTGTIVHDCASYMQQVGCPKRDLYLLSTCQGAPPFSLVIVPAPLKEGDPTQLVLYVAVATRLPMEFLSEIQSQAQQLATHVLAPVLQRKLVAGNIAEEWLMLQGKCASSRIGGAAGVPGGNSVQAAGVEQRNSTSALGSLQGAGGGAAASSVGPGGKEAGSGAVEMPAGSPGNSEYGAANAGGAAPAASTQGGQRGRSLASGLMSSMGQGSEPSRSVEPSRTGTNQTQSGVGGGRVLAGMASAHDSQTPVLSTALGGTFAGDTRTHMGMLVSSFKETINGLQAIRAEEAEELSVLKLGKVLGRGGSGLVFQGYLHLGLEVAVKLFENPDDTDPDAISADGGSHTHARALESSSNGQDSAAATGGGDAGGGGKTSGGNGGTGGGNGGKSDASPSAAAKHSSPAGGSTAGGGSKDTRAQDSRDKDANQARAAAQMTKRQRDLLRNALELGVTSSLSHPNIVQGYCHWVNVVLMQDASLNRCWLMGQAEYMALAPPGSPPPPLCSALVMEYCDMGSLIHAMKRGTFTGQDSKPNMEFIYMCLLEIALALRHLHTARLAHCDLKPGNVLLRSSPRDPRSFVCKLGDFGYAAILKDGLLPGRPAVLPDEACGTLQYMAPELFVAGRPVDASIDIYAFGMLMWELITGKTPYSDTDYGSRALMKAVYHGKRPTFPENTLQAYKNLAMCCWSGDPTSRPSAVVLVRLLRNQLESLKHSGSGSSSSNASVRA